MFSFEWCKNLKMQSKPTKINVGHTMYNNVILSYLGYYDLYLKFL